MPTTQAQRAVKARRLIAEAYGLDARQLRDRVVRVELLGDSVAAARVSVDGAKIPAVWVAQRQSTGRAVRVLRENREQFRSVHELVKYLEELYARHGGPRGEPPATELATAGRRGLRLIP